MSGPTEPLLSAADLPTGGSLADARVAVDAARPGEAASDRARLQILEFIATHDDALHRSCLEGHLTGSALVVEPAPSKLRPKPSAPMVTAPARPPRGAKASRPSPTTGPSKAARRDAQPNASKPAKWLGR